MTEQIPQSETQVYEETRRTEQAETLKAKKLTTVAYGNENMKADLNRDPSGETASATIDRRGRDQGPKIRAAYGDKRLPA